MNEIIETFFQVKPKQETYHSSCVFMNRGFRLGDVKYVTEVQTWDQAVHYRFSVYFYDDPQMLHPIHFDFNSKQKSVKAQREFLRAWTQTGEFAYVDRTTAEVGTEVTPATGLEDN